MLISSIRANWMRILRSRQRGFGIENPRKRLSGHAVSLYKTWEQRFAIADGPK